ncbi:MAG: PQQ-binding-like beta-propeller repeat protein [Sedimentisphaerales bacterium]|nr:PQQ-binding-like beta-propeller repeat protein [Sedimentisphaerales bacterium]
MSRMKTKITGSLKQIVVSCIFLLLGTESIYAQNTIFGSVINISNNSASKDTDPSVAASGDNIYIVWCEVNRENTADSRILFRYSYDNGQTWNPSLEEMPVDLGRGVEPKVTALGDYVYVTYRNEISVGVQQLNFRASLDRGLTWNPAITDPAIDLSSTEEGVGITPWLIPSHNLAASGNHVYVIWSGSRPGYDYLVAQFRRSSDNGVSWDSPLNHTPVMFADHGDDSYFPDVASYGTSVYVVWNALHYGPGIADQIFFARSTDSGATFDNEINVSNATLQATKPHIIAYRNEAYIVWGHIFMGSNLDLAIRKTSDNGTSWFPLLSDSPTRLIEDGLEWDIAGSESKVYVIEEAYSVPDNSDYRSIHYRESSDGATIWNPPVLEDPRTLVGPYEQQFAPRIAAARNHVYVAWEHVVPFWLEDTKEVLLRIGNHTSPGSTLSSWDNERQMNQHLASLNESPSLPLTLQWIITLPDAVKTTPVRHRNIERVYVGCDDRRIYALDPSTGSVVWNVPTSGRVGTSPTIEVGKGYENLFATSEDGKLYKLNPYTGEIKWTIETLPSSLMSSPMTDAGILYYVAQDELGSLLRAIDTFDGSIMWDMPLDAVTASTPMEAFRTIYIGIPQNHAALLGVHGINGNIVFRQTDDSPSAGSYTSGVPDLEATDYNIDSYPIYVGTRDRIIKAIRSNDRHVLWEEELPGFGTGPVTGMALTQKRSTNTLVVSQLNQLHALGPSFSDPLRFEIQWSRTFNGNLMIDKYKTPKPLIWGNYVFHVVEENRLVAFSLADGSEQWSYTLAAPTVSSPSVDGESLYIADNSGSVYRFLNPLAP